jgi:hypothetical protein
VIPKEQERNSQSTTSSQHEKSDFNIQNFKNKSNTDKTLPKPEHNTAHKKRYEHKPATHIDHANTKTKGQTSVLWKTLCFKLKSKRTAKNRPSLKVIPKKTAK